ncbi:NAD(P)/FAD-dependent oxidoreductase [Stappia sp.]|uniref:NAD(P)/FAD-dependent oxidoreductase n=1 Tax=Stappia sp. TaxID=1870903 RepID=UPI003A9985EB
MRRVDVVVLGAGITGVSAALHLQGRGLRVLLVDRRSPGEDTSRGNTGVLGRDGFSPVPLPSSVLGLAAHALSPMKRPRVEPRSVPALLPFLAAFRDATQPAAMARSARALAPLQGAAVGEHLALARAASALRFFRRTGWIKIQRSREALEAAEIERHFARVLGVPYADLAAQDIVRLEPHLRALDHAAMSWPESQSVSSPGGVTKAYARLFRERGGESETGDAATLVEIRGGYGLRTARGEIEAAQVVVALGVGAMPLLDRFGQGLPVAACRSYHRHFRAVSGVALSRPVTDVDAGFTLTPMERGLRLVGGAELLSPARATGDLAPRASALNRATTLVRKLLPLGAAVEEAPVAGLRAFVPDLLPIVGPVPGRPGLWLSIGHERDGFALAPAMGRLLADLMTGSLPLADPLPYAPARFLQV